MSEVLLGGIRKSGEEQAGGGGQEPGGKGVMPASEERGVGHIPGSWVLSGGLLSGDNSGQGNLISPGAEKWAC